MFNLSLYEDGLESGIVYGQHMLLLKLLKKKLIYLPEDYLFKLENLDSIQIIEIALAIFDITTLEDLDKHLI